MPDPFSGASGTTPQEQEILNRAKTKQKNARTFSSKPEDLKAKREKKKEPRRLSQLYKTGIEVLAAHGLIAILDESGDHCKHRILKAQAPPMVKGIQYPKDFNPLQDISLDEHFELMEIALSSPACPADVKEFWDPLIHPKAGDNDLLSFSMKKLQMQQISAARNIHQVQEYGHSFDPAGRLGKGVAMNPHIWVPDKEWFAPSLHSLKFSDVFTIFPEAEQEMLKLIMGRIGVGRTNHKPPGWEEPIDHTARMAGIIVGKDAG